MATRPRTALNPPPTEQRPASRSEHAREQIALSPVERDRLIRSVVASQALEGIAVSYEEAARLLDEVLSEPLATIE